MGVQGSIAFGTLFVDDPDTVEAVLFFTIFITIWVLATIAMQNAADFLAGNANLRAPAAMAIFMATFYTQVAANGAIGTIGTLGTSNAWWLFMIHTKP